MPDFYIAAVNPNADFLTDVIKVTISCVSVNTVTVAYNEGNNENFVEAYTSDGNSFKVFISTLSTTQTIVLSNTFTFVTNTV